jgi:murein DD-endopeptidase MepM/ murein hydrolase activator NlpD
MQMKMFNYLLIIVVMICGIFATNTSNAIANNTYYIVRPGDTMFKIAQAKKIPTQMVIKANPQIINPNYIRQGQKLYIPMQPSSHSNGTFPFKQGTYTPYLNNYADQRSWSPTGTVTRTHDGVDIFAAAGTPVYASKAGTIFNVGWNVYGGWRLTIRVDQNTVFYYAHFSGYARTFKLGDPIRQGELIGYVGSTGNGPLGTTGKFEPHLHFGIYSISPWQAINPYPYLQWWEFKN